MSMFPSALAAIEAGVEVQRRLAAPAYPGRVGVHVGDVVLEEERLTGIAVNVASRIESFWCLARCCSRTPHASRSRTDPTCR